MIRFYLLGSLFILITANGISQEWVATSYKDEWGDPSGKRLIEQKIEGLLLGTDFKLIVKISRDVPSVNNFKISAFDSDGKPFLYLKSKVKMKEGYSKEKYVKNPNMDPLAAGDAILVEGKYLFKSKVGEKESSFRISKPNTGNKKFTNTISVNYTELNAILLSASAPIKCIIAEDTGGGSISNIIRFTIYPANYKQLVH